MTMNSLTRGTMIRAGAVIAAVGLAGGLAVAPATAAPQQQPKYVITIHTSDKTPASGQSFYLSGLVFRNMPDGYGVPGKKVQLRTYRNGQWVNVTGATMKSDSDGDYNLRTVLSAPGPRKVRAVATVNGKMWRSRILTVQVH